MKRYVSLVLAFLASLGIWLISNLSQSTSDLVSAQVVAVSSIDGRAESSRESVQVVAYVTTSGFRMARLRMRRSRVVRVYVEPTDLFHKEGDYFSISANSLLRYSTAIFGEGIKVENIASDYTVFRFAPETCKKVPVMAIRQIRFRPQYMAREEMHLSPDSVLVYGDPARLKEINQVFTRQITHLEVDHSIHGTTTIETPSGMRLSSNQVSYSMEVRRFVEYKTKVAVSVRNVPEGRVVNVFPSEVDATWRFVFPISGNPASAAEFYVDYEDFASSIGGKCIVKVDGVPDMAITWETEPQFCGCVETLL